MRSLRSRKSKIAYPMSKARAVPLGPFFPHCHISTATSTTLFHLGLPITAHLHWMVLLLHPPLSSKHPSSIPTPQVSASWVPLCWKIERILECPSRKTSNTLSCPFPSFKHGKQCPGEEKVLHSVHEPQGACRLGVQEENKSEPLLKFIFMLKLRRKSSFATT